jgi:hypothetical protein
LFPYVKTKRAPHALKLQCQFLNAPVLPPFKAVGISIFSEFHQKTRSFSSYWNHNQPLKYLGLIIDFPLALALAQIRPGVYG